MSPEDKDPNASGRQPHATREPPSRGLPGLPIESKLFTANDAGLAVRRAPDPVAYGWSQVRQLTWAKGGVIVAVRDAATMVTSEFFVREADAGGREGLKRLVGAWREWVLRQIERDGHLEGGIVDTQHTRNVGDSAIACGAMLVAMVVLGALLFVREITWWVLLMGLLHWGFPAVGSIMIGIGLAERRRIAEHRESWSNWTLSPAGLTRRLDGMTFLPRREDSVGPEAARCGGQDLAWHVISHGEVVRPLMLALAERAGAALRVRVVRWWALAVDAIIIGSTLGVSYAITADTKGTALAMKHVIAMATLSVGALAVSLTGLHLLSRKSLRMDLEQGRAMLQRLGW